MKKLFLLIILLIPFAVSAETKQEVVDHCINDLDFEYVEQQIPYKDYIARYKGCYIENSAEDIMPANLQYEVTEEAAAVADCQINATNRFNSKVSECISDLQAKLQSDVIKLGDFNKLYPTCSSGNNLQEYQAQISSCYESADFGWVWEFPVLKESFTSMYDDYKNLSVEESQKLNICLTEVNESYDLTQISSEIQNEISKCFALVGLTGLSNVYEKISITVDCAEDSLGVENLNDAQMLIASATEKQKAYMEQCIIKKTAPVVTGIALVNIPFAVGGFQSAIYLQFLFIQLFYIFIKRKSGKVGLVYDSFTKKPLDLTIVRLFDEAKEKIVGSFVTGKNGRYIFLPRPGKYKLNVRKSEFSFPSKLSIRKEEEYFGEILDIQNEEEVIVENIPLDPQVKEKKVWAWNWNRRKEKFAFSIAMIAPMYSLTSLIFVQKLWLILLAVVNLLLLLVYLRLRKKKEKNQFGLVVNSDGKKLKNVVVSIFETKFKKKLAYTVTDSWGRYYFPAVAGEYILVAEKRGYKRFDAKIRIKQCDVDSKNVSVNITLKK